MSDLMSDDRLWPKAQGAGAWNPFMGIFALWLGLMWLLARMMMIIVPVGVAIMIPVLVASYRWGEVGSSVATLIAGLAALPFWLPPAFRFFFPAYFDLLRLSGVFLQRTGNLQPKDALGAINRRWDALHTDGRRWWRMWLAQN